MSSMAIMNLIREYGPESTRGSLFVNGELLGYTLEDVARPTNVKFYGSTCIPEGVYCCRCVISQRFNKRMVAIRSWGEVDSVVRGGIRFHGVRIHGGNDTEDTDGCVLLGAQSNHINRIWDCAEVNRKLLDYVTNNPNCTLVISSRLTC